MAKFIYVWGDDDYSAVMFENSKHTPESIYFTMKKNNTKELTLDVEVDDYVTEVTFQLLEFGDVDPAFESFVLNEICDYDALKASTIYRVED